MSYQESLQELELTYFPSDYYRGVYFPEDRIENHLISKFGRTSKQYTNFTRIGYEKDLNSWISIYLNPIIKEE